MPKGFQGVRKASAELEAKRGSGTGALWFRLPNSGDEAVVRFLEEGDDIHWANMHEVPVEGRSWGADVPCLDQENEGIDCPGCKADLPIRFKGYVNLIWRDAPVFKRDEKGKIVKDRTGDIVVTGHKDQVAIWSSGIRLFEELDEINENYKGLGSRDFRVKRKGTGLDTKYVITAADVDGGAQPLSDDDKDLVEDKYDLNVYTNPPSAEDFEKRIAGETPSGGNSSDGATGSSNPFLRDK